MQQTTEQPVHHQITTKADAQTGCVEHDTLLDSSCGAPARAHLMRALLQAENMPVAGKAADACPQGHAMGLACNTLFHLSFFPTLPPSQPPDLSRMVPELLVHQPVHKLQ